MKYLVTYETGNGDWCHCHRVTSTHTAEYHSLEDVAVDMFIKWKGYRGDLRIEEIYTIEEVEIDKEVVDSIKAEFKILTNDARSAERTEKEVEKMKSEKRLFERLKAKFKGGT